MGREWDFDEYGYGEVYGNTQIFYTLPKPDNSGNIKYFEFL
jgi:hypothetical protein